MRGGGQMMKMQTIRTVLLLVFSVIGVAGSLGYWMMYRRGFGQPCHFWAAGVFVLLPLLFLALEIWGPRLPLPMPALRALSYVTGYWLAFFHYSLYVAAGWLLLRLAGRLFPGGWLAAAEPLYLRAGALLVALVICYGAWQAAHPVVRRVTLDTGRHGTRPVTVVLVTDLHLGSLYGSATSRELVELVNREKPDVVLFGGDLLDSSLVYPMREGSHLPLKDLESRWGVYAVPGNHDHYTGAVPREMEMFSRVGIRFLVDEAVELPEGILLAGLEDYATERMNPHLEELAAEHPGSRIRILMEHQPWNPDRAAAAGYDLYLAGHTHGGQMAPLNLVPRSLYRLDYGTARVGDMLAVVSCGFGLWGAPVRIGSRPEIVVITIR